ncbi:MAG TPA: Calx-beta domain-containing protein [Pyrinomonadaceae bacterium]|jgi:photosystem II stability/assembly factor-like uncharacterized protein
MPYYLNNRKLMRGLATPLSFILAGVIVISCHLAGGPLEGARAATSRQSPARASAAAAQWTRSGPHGGTLTAIAVSQSAPATVYAHVSAAGAYYDTTPTGFFKSTDGGSHWTRMGYPPLPVFPHRFLSLAVDPTDPDVVYAGTVRSGIYKTTDGGVTWSGSYGFQEREVTAIAIDPVNTSTVYASFSGRGFYKSTDGGVTWASPGSGNGPGFGVRAIRIDPSNRSIIYTASGGGGVFKSTDSGVNWTRKGTGLSFASVADLVIDPSNTSTLYVGTSRGVFKSTDGADNWVASSAGLPLNDSSFFIAINPASPSTLYAVNYYYAPGIFKSADGGATWTHVGAAATRFSLLAVGADGENVYAGSFSGGMFRSAAGGPWAEANEGLPYASVRHVVADANNPARVYVGSGQDVYRSEDRGQSWGVSALPLYERPIMGLVADPSQPSTLFAAPDYVGVFKSDDGGLNWKQVIDAGNINIQALAIAPSRPHNLYFSTYGLRLYRGAEGGEAWTEISSRPGSVTAFAADPSNSSVVYAAGINLYKSTNSGTSWSGLFAYDATTVSEVNGILVDPSSPSTLYVHSSGSAAPVRKSTDGGLSWVNASAGLPATGASGSYSVSALIFDPVKPSVLYAACRGTAEAGGGVYRSADGGASWGAFNPPLANVNALAFDLSGRTLYAGADGGLFKAATDAAPLTFSTDLFTAGESAGTATVTVTRDSGAGAAAVNYATSDGTATAGADYHAASGTLAFADGETSKTFDVTILDDTTDEFDKAVRLTLTSADGAVLARASLVIIDDDLPPALTVGDVSAHEGDFDTTEFVFHVSLSSPSAKTVTASVNSASGTAVSGGGDLFAYAGPYVLQFNPGETDKTVTILVRGDLEVEPDEDFFVNVSNVVNATAADAQGRGVILNDDATPTVSLSINDVSVVEGNSGTTDAVFTVSLSAPTAKTVKVDYFSFGGEGTELQPFGGSLTFAPGETSKNLTVRVIGDTRFEPDETFSVRLANPRNALMPDNTGLLTILNDEQPPTISIDDVTVTEGDAGEKTVVFTVSLSVDTEQQVSFSYDAVAGTATENQDYARVFGAALFVPTVTRRTISVPVKGDTIDEADETFSVRISNPTNGATVADGEGVCTIIDNDGSGGAPTFQFSAAEYNVQESAGEAVITVTRSGDLSAPAAVDYTTHRSNNARSASDRSDYTAAAGTLRFGAGEGFKTFKVLITDDAFAERDTQFGFGDEFIDLSLSNPTGGGAALGNPKDAFITIVDNETVTGAQNPIDTPELFVRQHYHDFLNREPDPGGLAHWKNEFTQCGADAGCREVKRVNVSAAFFLSIEFQETGYLVYRFYKAAYGDATSPNVEGSVPIVRLGEFLIDTQQIGQGVQVNVGNWQQQIAANKQAYALDFVQRQRFLTAFPEAMTAEEFVGKLDQNAGQLLSPDEKAQLVSSLGSTPADASKRAAALRQVAENALLRQREFNRAFVLMQYFGYLRRNPDDPQDADFRGWNFWLGKLDEFNGDYVRAEMVKAFITSDEYRRRFGQ